MRRKYVEGMTIDCWTIETNVDAKYAMCRCVCGTRRLLQKGSLGRSSTSCGCSRGNSKSYERHGRTDTPEYKAWEAMKARCYQPGHISYPRWGGRGIAVCERWRDSFLAFYEDMGDCPPGYSLERIEVDCNYEPGNCKWATRKEQMNNMTKNVFIEYDGRRQTLAQWAEEAGLKYQTFVRRVQVMGETLPHALRPAAPWRGAKSGK